MYEKSKDTLDVWFDSGTTHMTVMRGSHADKLTYPADLYLEGSDSTEAGFTLLCSRLRHRRPCSL